MAVGVRASLPCRRSEVFPRWRDLAGLGGRGLRGRLGRRRCRGPALGVGRAAASAGPAEELRSRRGAWLTVEWALLGNGHEWTAPPAPRHANHSPADA